MSSDTKKEIKHIIIMFFLALCLGFLTNPFLTSGRPISLVGQIGILAILFVFTCMVAKITMLLTKLIKVRLKRRTEKKEDGKKEDGKVILLNNLTTKVISLNNLTTEELSGIGTLPEEWEDLAKLYLAVGLKEKGYESAFWIITAKLGRKIRSSELNFLVNRVTTSREAHCLFSELKKSGWLEENVEYIDLVVNNLICRAGIHPHSNNESIYDLIKMGPSKEAIKRLIDYFVTIEYFPDFDKIPSLDPLNDLSLDQKKDIFGIYLKTAKDLYHAGVIKKRLYGSDASITEDEVKRLLKNALANWSYKSNARGQRNAVEKIFHYIGSGRSLTQILSYVLENWDSVVGKVNYEKDVNNGKDIDNFKSIWYEIRDKLPKEKAAADPAQSSTELAVSDKIRDILDKIIEHLRDSLDSMWEIVKKTSLISICSDLGIESEKFNKIKERLLEKAKSILLNNEEKEAEKRKEKIDDALDMLSYKLEIKELPAEFVDQAVEVNMDSGRINRIIELGASPEKIKEMYEKGKINAYSAKEFGIEIPLAVFQEEFEKWLGVDWLIKFAPRFSSNEYPEIEKMFKQLGYEWTPEYVYLIRKHVEMFLDKDK